MVFLVSGGNGMSCRIGKLRPSFSLIPLFVLVLILFTGLVPLEESVSQEAEIQGSSSSPEEADGSEAAEPDSVSSLSGDSEDSSESSVSSSSDSETCSDGDIRTHGDEEADREVWTEICLCGEWLMDTYTLWANAVTYYGEPLVDRYILSREENQYIVLEEPATGECVAKLLFKKNYIQLLRIVLAGACPTTGEAFPSSYALGKVEMVEEHFWEEINGSLREIGYTEARTKELPRPVHCPDRVTVKRYSGRIVTMYPRRCFRIDEQGGHWEVRCPELPLCQNSSEGSCSSFAEGLS